MRYLSLFSGIEAATVAWKPLGWEPVAFCEIDPFPSAVLAHHYPDIPNLGDITKVDWDEFKEEYGEIDIIIGGSPCFPAGSLVLCESGFKPIECVRVGDKVVTHEGRLRRVLRTGSKIGDTIVLKGQGSVGIECTPNHPFYSREGRHTRNVATWRDASDMRGKFWLNVCNVEETSIPSFPAASKGTRGRGYIESFEFTEPFFYFIGRWLGDGWANQHIRKNRVDSRMKRVYVCCSHDEAENLGRALNETGLHFNESNNGSVVRFTCASTQLYDWVVNNFGIHADGKNIPAWCLGMEPRFRKALVDGYLDADGTQTSNGYKSTTINRALSLGIKALVGSLGMASSVTKVQNNRDCVIEGRHVNEHPNYVSSHYLNSRSAFFADSGFYGLVRNVTEGHKQTRVYNLEVEDDNSYTVDGIAVHNCQSFSVAGNREGLQGESKLMFEYVRAIREVMPRYFIWENVPGALSSGPKGQKGSDFGCLLRELANIGRSVGREREQYGLAWRVLDASLFGVPQRRRRVFLVGCLGTDSAAEILFESESLHGDNPSSREKRQECAQAAGRGVACESGAEGRAGGKINAVCFAQNNREEVRLQNGDGEITGPVCASIGFKGQGVPYVMIARQAGTNGNNQSYICESYESKYVIRQLMPIECERLQGFPDNYTDIPWKGKEHAPDSKRYKAIGNSFAVPVVRWLGERLQEVNDRSLP